MGGAGISNASRVSGEQPLAGKTILYHDNTAINGETILHTVTAGKTYHLLMAEIDYHASGDALTSLLYIDSNARVIMGNISHTCVGNATDSAAVYSSFPYPIPIEAGAEIKVFSNGAALATHGIIVGWEE